MASLVKIEQLAGWAIASIFTVAISVLFTVSVLNPLWKSLDLHVPNEPQIRVDFTELVDSVFYVRNAELGYAWDAKATTSIWFHPFLVWAMHLFPATVPYNVRFWLLSVIAASSALTFLNFFIKHISLTPVRSRTLLLLPIFPSLMKTIIYSLSKGFDNWRALPIWFFVLSSRSFLY